MSTSTRPTPFRCPACLDDLALAERDGASGCARCGWEAASRDGVPTFVRDPALRAEAEHYDSAYAAQGLTPPVEVDALGQLWAEQSWAPFNRTMLDAMGPLEGRTVVCLGNGLATKELFFLTQEPRALVVSDLSATAMRAVRDHYPELRDRDDLFFAAIDGQELPFADGSVSVVYGYAFAHHLPDLDRFVAEVARVLEPGGRGVFMDSAYSPVWQWAKTGPLARLMRFAHLVSPISEEDQRFTRAGGFRHDDLQRSADAAGCDLWFAPTGNVHYLATRASGIFAKRWPALRLGRRAWVLTGRDRHRLTLSHSGLLSALYRLDRRLERFKWVRANRMRLVWGLDKPPRT